MLRHPPLPFSSALTAVAFAALLSACAHLPDAAPPVRVPDAPLSATAGLRADAPAPTLDAWWEGFHDPLLTDLVQRALDQNLDLAVAFARADQARSAAQAAGAQRLPQFDLLGNVLQQRQSLKSPEGELARHSPGYERSQTYQALGVGASWEADLAGGLRQGENAAVAEWQAAEAARAGARVTVVAEVADAYFRARGAQARIAIAEAQVKQQGQLLDLVQDRFEHGLATQRDTAGARAQLQQARGTLPPLQTELAQQLHRLDVLVGEQAGTGGSALKSTTPSLDGVPALPATITPAELMRRRPDVIAAERQLDASQARIGVAAAEYYPHLSLGGLLGGVSLHGALFSSEAFQPQAFLGLRWRLFDFGRVDAEVVQARGARAEALARLRNSMLRATEDVENAIVNLAQLEAQRAELVQEVDARRTARDEAADAYRGGAIGLFEVLQEDRQLLAASDQLAQLQAARARAAVAAFRALGGGWAPAAKT